MAKRGGSDLNHDNWDQDVEGESAGVFQKAGASELKGRVIKKARRRNVGDDSGAPKNAFSSFGGFAGAAKPSAEASFSFLGGDKKPEAASMFGSVAAKPSFAFGSSSSGADVAKPANTFGAFSFGAKAEEKKAEPVKVSPLSPLNDNKALDSAPKGDLSSMFKPKTGTWSCDVCMVSNPADKVQCLACETPKPGCKPEPKPAPSFGDSGGFKFGSNDGGGKAEGGFSIGAAGAGSTSSFSATSSGFTFGAAKTETAPISGGFSFGDKSSSGSSADKPSTGGFSFGATTAAEKPATTTGFVFGSSKPAETSTPTSDVPASSLFSFGAKPAATSPKPEKVSGFAFGAKKSESPKPKEQASFGAFAFGSKTTTENKVSPRKPESNGKSEAAGKTAEEKMVESGIEYSSDYLAHLKALNLQVTDWIQRHVSEDPLVLLSPVFQDYEQHLKELSVKFPTSTNKTSSTSKPVTNQTNSFGAATEAPKPFSIGSGKDSSDTPKPFAIGSSSDKKSDPAPFSFGSSSKSEGPSAPKAFSFGSSSSESKAESAPGGGFSFGSNMSKPGGGFSFGSGGVGGGSMFAAPAQPAAAEANQQEEEEDQPPKVEVKVVKEDDALYSKKCKLFYKKEGNYCEKGVGMLYLKTADSGKTQLLVRADTNLGNILLNIILNPDIPTTRVGKNNVMLVCVPNPPIDPKATTSEPTPMLIRVKTTEDADDLKEKLDDFKMK